MTSDQLRGGFDVLLQTAQSAAGRIKWSGGSVRARVRLERVGGVRVRVVVEDQATQEADLGVAQ